LLFTTIGILIFLDYWFCLDVGTSLSLLGKIASYSDVLPDTDFCFEAQLI